MKKFGKKGLLFLLLSLAFSLSLASCGKGGTPSGQPAGSIVLQAVFSEGATDTDKALDIQAAIDIIRTRLHEYGVTKPNVQPQGNDCILVQLAGITDIEEAKKLISQRGLLEFRQAEMNGTGTVSLGDYLNDTTRSDFFDPSDATVAGTNRVFVDGDGQPIVFLEKSDEGLKYVDKDGNPVDTGQLDKTALSWMPAWGTIDGLVNALNGMYLGNAKATEEPFAQSAISFEWTQEGVALFNQIAKRLRDRGDYGTDQRTLGIFLDNVRISAPQVYPPDMTGDYGNKATVVTDFTQNEAKLVAIQLRSGALPVPFRVVQ